MPVMLPQASAPMTASVALTACSWVSCPAQLFQLLTTWGEGGEGAGAEAGRETQSSSQRQEPGFAAHVSPRAEFRLKMQCVLVG